MKYEKLQCVVLTLDIPEYRLRAGDLGTVVEIYPGGGVEVEFFKVSGATQALLSLSEKDIRKIDPQDLLATRRLAKVS